MDIVLASSAPIQSLHENGGKDIPADFLIDDLMAVFKLEDTCALNNESIAEEKKLSGKLKYFYKLSIEIIDP